jgi:hypothetical protein
VQGSDKLELQVRELAVAELQKFFERLWGGFEEVEVEAVRVEVGVGLSLLGSENRIAHATNDLHRRIIGALIYAPFCPVSVTYYLKRSHNISVFLFFHDQPPLCVESRLSKSTSTDMAKRRK